MQPVKRDAPPPVMSSMRGVTTNANKTSLSKAELAAIDPNLVRRKVWLLGFRNRAPVNATLKDLPVQEKLGKGLEFAFSRDASPYVTEITDDSGLEDLKVDSNYPLEDIQRLAKGAGLGGYITGDITEFSIKTQQAPEGLLRNVTSQIKLAVEFEFYDASVGRKIFSGTAFETITETRAQLLTDSGEDPEELKRKLDRLATGLGEKILVKLRPYAEKLGWQGKVVRMDGSRMFINAGRRSGIQVGDTLRVVGPGRDVTDPQTGQHVGEAPGRLKALIKVSQHFGLDGAMCVLLSGGGVSLNDRVELY